MSADFLGVNVAGYIRSEIGLGEAVRANIRALQAARIPMALRDIPLFVTETPDDTFGGFTDGNPYPINLTQVNMDHDERIHQQLGDAFRAGKYNIGYWSWELSRFPEQFHPSFRFYDEIWTLSEFARDSIQAVSPVPVTVVPPSLSLDALSLAKPDRKRFGIPEHPFVFLSSFDFCSCLERKNPLGLVHAFSRAFQDRQDVLLLLKSSHSRLFPKELEALRRAAPSSNVRVLDGVFTRAQAYDLIASADAYVSLHRAEGFGLPLAEAMALGKPVIATGYSGNMDFMRPGISFLVDFKKAAVGKHEHVCPYPPDAQWAEPDADHAVQLLRKVFEDRTASLTKAAQGRRDAEALLAPAVVGRIMQRRLAGVLEDRRKLLPHRSL